MVRCKMQDLPVGMLYAAHLGYEGQIVVLYGVQHDALSSQHSDTPTWVKLDILTWIFLVLSNSFF